MLDNMSSNRAYVHARDAAGGDPDGALLADFQERFRAYRAGWRALPAKAIKNKLTGDAFREHGHGPLCIDLETAAICDLACPFCYRQWVATPDKVMSKDLAFRLIDQAADLNVPSMKFNWRGEPLMNPKLSEIIAHAKDSGIIDTLLNSNATHLDEKMARAIIEAGLDHVIYSFDGGSETSYNKMRPGRFNENTFQAVYANIRRFSEIRREMGSPFPFTKIQMILTEETFHEQDEFFELFSDCVDDVSVKAYTERGGNLKDLDDDTRDKLSAAFAERGIEEDENAQYWRDADDDLMIAAGRLACEQPYQRLMVAYDGRTSMCCYDWGNEHPVGYVDQTAIDLGDKEFKSIQEKAERGANGFELMKNVSMPKRYSDPPREVSTLADIWYGDTIDAARKMHVDGHVNDMKICTQCPFKDTYKWEKVPG
tara:strand:+ start:22580 stop:23857 length:1278 start_codon:yes stop_codon:yes gene_type:complete